MNTRGWWERGGVGVILLAGVTGCLTPASQDDTKTVTPQDFPQKETVWVEHEKANDSIQLLVRDFLRDREDHRFGYFVYLIFTEQTQATYNKRLAAAEAFLCQYSSLSQAGDLGLKKPELAVFYAPIRTRTQKDRLTRSGSAGALLKEYRYAGSHYLLRQLRVRNTSQKERFDFLIGIIGSPVPLMTRMAEIEVDSVQVLNLEKKTPFQIAKTIQLFRRELKIGSEEKIGRGAKARSDLAERVQHHFMRINALKIPARPDPGDAEEPCR